VTAHTNGTVEAGGAAAAEPVLAQRLDGAVADELVARKPGEVIARHVDDRLGRVEQTGFGSIGSDYDRNSREVGGFSLRERNAERLRGPVVDELVDFLAAWYGRVRHSGMTERGRTRTFSENLIKCLPSSPARVRCWRIVKTRKAKMRISTMVRPGSFWWDERT